MCPSFYSNTLIIRQKTMNFQYLFSVFTGTCMCGKITNCFLFCFWWFWIEVLETASDQSVFTVYGQNHTHQTKGQFIVILSIRSRILCSIILTWTRSMHLFFVPAVWWRNCTLFDIECYMMSNTLHFGHQATGTKNKCIAQVYIKVSDRRIWDWINKMTMNQPLSLPLHSYFLLSSMTFNI